MIICSNGKISSGVKANSWVPSTSNFYAAIYHRPIVYTLSIGKAPELGAMNRLKEFKYLSNEAKWRLAAALPVGRDKTIALDLISGLATFPCKNQLGFYLWIWYKGWSHGTGNININWQKAKAEELVRTIAAKLSQDYWYSTQTTAYSLIAILQNSVAKTQVVLK